MVLLYYIVFLFSHKNNNFAFLEVKHLIQNTLQILFFYYYYFFHLKQGKNKAKTVGKQGEGAGKTRQKIAEKKTQR